MKFAATLAAGAAVVAGVSAQAQNQSLCDKYTTALLMENNGTNQQTLLTLVVNTALIGNYTSNPGSLNKVDGILNPNGGLVKYFDGSLKSTNENGQATAVNWLDGGGAEPLMKNLPGNEGSRQATLVNHLYQYFGALLGCTAAGFPAYAGETSQSSVHRFMNLNAEENNYFITQVGSAATSFGVSAEDATAVGNILNTTFNVRCAPAAPLPAGSEPASQSVCLASSCPLAENSNCQASGNSYPNGTNGVAPASAATSMSGSGSGSASGSASGTASGSGAAATTSSRPDGASVNVVNAFGALALAAAGLVAVGL